MARVFSRSALGITALVMALGIVAAPHPAAEAVEWTELGPAPLTQGSSGPFTGRTSAIVASPTDPNKYFVAGASGGVWRTVDGGVSWTPLTDDLPINSIGALAIDPFDENIIYAGSGEANFANHSIYGLGLYKSTDGGDTWAVLAAGTFAGRTFSRVVVSHADGQVLFASIMHAGGFPARNAAKGHPQTDGPVGVFRSFDGGVTWTHLTNGLPAVAASDVWMDPADASTLYAAIGDIFAPPENGVYKSTDGGDSWTKLGGGFPETEVGRITLAIAPSMAGRLFAIVTMPTEEDGGGARTKDVYRSNDGGATWVGTGSGNFQATYGWYLSTAIVDPNNPNILFAGGLGLIRTNNAGGNYHDVTPQHVDMHGLAYDANHRLLCANDGGVHRSADNGSTWEPLNDGLGVIQFYAGLSLHPTNETYVIGGSQDNGTLRRTEEGVVWSNRLGGDGGCTSLARSMPFLVFAEFQGTRNIYFSNNSGNSFTWRGDGINGGDRNCFMPPVTHNPSNWRRLLFATHRVYGTNNGGAHWGAISEDLTGGPPAAIRALVIAPSNSDTVYAATNDGRVLVSTDGGANWDLKLTDVPGWPRITREIAVDPQDDSVAYLAVAQFGVDQIRRTTDRGDTWTAIDGDLPDVPANTVAVYRQGDQRAVFVGTDAGVYVSFVDETRWSKYGTGMPNSPVIDLLADPTFDRIVAATLGRGAWVIRLPNLGDPDADQDVDLADLWPLQNCFSGSHEEQGFVAPSSQCLDLFDFDLDGDVDLADLARYVDRLSGPQ